MKKPISIILAMSFVVCAALAFTGCESSKPDQTSYNREEESQTEQPELTAEPTGQVTEPPVTEAPTAEPTEEPTAEPTELPADASEASEETRALAAVIISKLSEVHFAKSLAILYTEQYATRLNRVPELEQLEKAEDSALALIEIYESYIDYFANAELTLYLSTCTELVNDPDHEVPEGFYEWLETEACRTDIEILISQSVHYDKLTEAQKARFFNALTVIWNKKRTAQTEAYGEGNAAKHSDFDYSRKEQDNDWEYVVGEQDRLTYAFTWGGIDYYVGTNVTTTSGLVVMTFASGS